MKTTLALSMVLGFLCLNNSYQNQFPLEYEKGVDYCNSISNLSDEIANQYCLDGSTILAIGLPEACRYSAFSDEVETSALTYFNLNDSTSLFDFSIGEFQMKPSFAKRIELLASSYTGLEDFQNVFNYSGNAKQERLERLAESNWQIKYICCMVTYLNLKHDLGPNNIEFLSAAYNYGFESSKSEIIKWQSAKAFPHGLNSHYQNHSYSTISATYFLNQ
ncbi:MAG: hypothetical protein ACI9J3_002124 [Parvicellaceae bacterium]|jgi:hypothetical protein